MKKIALLGSTGSIGTRVLDVISSREDDFKVTALACGENIDKLEDQIRKFNPDVVSVKNDEDVSGLAEKFPDVQVGSGRSGLISVATCNCDVVVNALMGITGLEPTYKAIMAGKDIALANKETLVAGGELIMKAVSDNGVKLMPIDSEHSAIWQCLRGNDEKTVKRIILTGSGGPFRDYSMEAMEHVHKEQALRHPNWDMGEKITIDSATMMNKGLEVIEARWLFDIDYDNIDVIVHPQSIIHSMVEFTDTSVIAQMGIPDMRLPIAYALNWPERKENGLKRLDLIHDAERLTFEEADFDKFRCLKVAYDAARKGGSAPAAMNAANEVLVERHLNDRLRFMEIPRCLERVMADYEVKYDLDIDAILQEDRIIREKTLAMVEGK